MNTLRDLATAMSIWDWLAVVLFFLGWAGYARFAKRRAAVQPSLLAAGNRIRHQWMLEVTRRDNRVLDGVVVQNLSTSPSFFASTTILIIGGLLALLGTSDHAKSLVAELPFAARTSALLLDLKLVLLTAIFVYAFFRFTWSLRQYGFGVLLVASCPEPHDFVADDHAQRERFATRAGGVVALAAETFNDGLRAYYFAFAAAAWLLSPIVFAAATVGVVWVLYQREFHSQVLSLMLGTAPDGGP
jgi:uncharacterized membrane protein